MAEITIKREIWNRKRVIVARNEKGIFFTWKKESKKFNLNNAKILFKKNRTFSSTITAEKLKNVEEVIDFSPRPRIPDIKGAVKYQYFVEGSVKGKTIIARSLQHELSYPKNLARREAEESFFERVADALGLEYDEDVGKRNIDKIRFIREGIVYYRPIR